MKKLKLCKNIFHITKLELRNDVIIIAIEDGYTQSQIAKHLKLSDLAVSKIVIEKRKSGNS